MALRKFMNNMMRNNLEKSERRQRKKEAKKEAKKAAKLEKKLGKMPAKQEPQVHSYPLLASGIHGQSLGAADQVFDNAQPGWQNHTYQPVSPAMIHGAVQYPGYGHAFNSTARPNAHGNHRFLNPPGGPSSQVSGSRCPIVEDGQHILLVLLAGLAVNPYPSGDYEYDRLGPHDCATLRKFVDWLLAGALRYGASVVGDPGGNRKTEAVMQGEAEMLNLIRRSTGTSSGQRVYDQIMDGRNDLDELAEYLAWILCDLDHMGVQY